MGWQNYHYHPSISLSTHLSVPTSCLVHNFITKHHRHIIGIYRLPVTWEYVMTLTLDHLTITSKFKIMWHSSYKGPAYVVLYGPSGFSDNSSTCVLVLFQHLYPQKQQEIKIKFLFVSSFNVIYSNDSTLSLCNIR